MGLREAIEDSRIPVTAVPFDEVVLHQKVIGSDVHLRARLVEALVRQWLLGSPEITLYRQRMEGYTNGIGLHFNGRRTVEVFYPQYDGPSSELDAVGAYQNGTQTHFFAEAKSANLKGITNQVRRGMDVLGAYHGHPCAGIVFAPLRSSHRTFCQDMREEYPGRLLFVDIGPSIAHIDEIVPELRSAGTYRIQPHSLHHHRDR